MKRLQRDRRQARLLAQSRAGDARAFRKLYAELYEALDGYLGPRVARIEEREDLLSQIFHRFLENLDAFNVSRGSVQAWVLRMARNALIDHWRTRKASQDVDELAELLADGASDPLRRLIDEEEARFVGGILAGYPAEVREIFALRFGQGLRYREIGEYLGISEQAVKQRFSRTLRELRQRMLGRETKRGEVDYAI